MDDLARKVMADPATHFWVKNQYKLCLTMDPVDALNNAKLLAAMLQNRWEIMRREFHG